MAAARQMRVELQLLKARNPFEISEGSTRRPSKHSRHSSCLTIRLFGATANRWLHWPRKDGSRSYTALSEFVPEGGLISYGPYRPDLYRRTAVYVDKNSQRRQAIGPACRAADEVRAASQHESCEVAGPHDPPICAGAGGQGDRMMPAATSVADPLRHWPPLLAVMHNRRRVRM